MEDDGHVLKNRVPKEMEEDVFTLIHKWGEEKKSNKEVLDVFFSTTCRILHMFYGERWKEVMCHQLEFTKVEDVKD